MRIPLALAGLVLWTGPVTALAQDVQAVRPLRVTALSESARFLPQDTRLLNDPASLERFLNALDGAPPDWATVHGRGHGDPGHDDRLFALNRERDRRREGKPALGWRVAFVWHGELSDYDPKAGGFSVALGPKFTQTKWGMVRFKAEDLPGNLMAIPNPSLRRFLRKQVEQGKRVEIDVVMTGRLIAEESLIYDFSHDEPGLGMIMPVVRVERLDYVMR